MKSFVVYTAIIGGYDEIRQPLVVDDRFDYIIFSNDINEDRIGVWQIRHFEYSNPIQTKIARWVKTHPEELLQEYEFSLWIDSNIQIRSCDFYKRFDELVSNHVLVSTIKHPDFDCIYDELFYMIYGHYDREYILIQWGHYLEDNKYPHHKGDAETCILFRSHKNDKVKKMDEIWWNSIEKYSRRDQLSFMYSLWMVGVQFIPFLPVGINVRESALVAYYSHENSRGKYLLWQKNEAWLCRYAEKHPESVDQIKEVYSKILTLPFPVASAFLAGQYYRIRDFIFRKCLK